MKSFKALSFAVLAGAILWLASPAAAAEWTTDYKAAVDQAKKSDKVVLVDFTGSDWCVWCKKLKAEVFDTDAFMAWADKNAVLLELDFPKEKELPAELKAQNDKLQKKFDINAFPTILFLNGDGREIGRSSYLPGGPDAWTKNAGAIVEASRITPLTSLAAALKAAKEESKPVLLVSAGKDEQAKDAAALFRDFDLAKYAKFRLVVAYEDPKACADGSGPTAELGAKLSLKGTRPMRLVLVDSSGEKVLFSNDEILSPGLLLAALRKALPPVAYDGSWIEDYAKAQFLAGELNRPIMLDFTGSDWCEWCHKLDKEIFSTDAFKNYAKEKLVLVTLDFPQHREMPEAVKKQNLGLRLKYAVRGYPTLVLLSPAGEKLGDMGYMEGGPDAFLPELKKTIKDVPAENSGAAPAKSKG